MSPGALHLFDPARPLPDRRATRAGVGVDAEVALPGRLNWLRAGVLGANDGIVSTAAIVLGMAGATADRGPILFAGLIGLLAGALSMAAGEYVSVSTQRDTERALLTRERQRLAVQPDAGTGRADRRVHRTRSRPRAGGPGGRRAHPATTRWPPTPSPGSGSTPSSSPSPGTPPSRPSSSFVLGAAIPLLAAAIGPHAWYVVGAVAVALVVTGVVSARLGRAPVAPAVARNVAGGLLAMGVTFGLGSLVGGTLL